MSPEKETVSHRNHPLRGLQRRLEGTVEKEIDWLFTHGLLSGTQLEKKMEQNQQPQPDDLTLAGVELTIEAAKLQVNTGLNGHLLRLFFTGGYMDASDGRLARLRKLQSPDGAIKDVLADRASEIYIAGLIARNRAACADYPDNLESDLIIASALSTLTKAGCEMTTAHTDEAGAGGMIRRRIDMVKTLINIGKLNRPNAPHLISRKIEHGLLKAIDSRNALLIQSSHERASERAELIRQAITTTAFGWDNPALDDPSSAEAIEAGKYVAVIMMIRELTEIDMVDQLNALNEEVQFPQPEILVARYPYIGVSLKNIQPFINTLMAVIRENS